MVRWSINLFRVRGIQLTLHGSFVLLLAYYGYAGYKQAGISGLAWAIALLFAFFTCVVLHELGHSLTARRFGVGVRRILLMPIGGMAEFDSIPREPRKELLITVAGPSVNFVIVVLLGGALLLLGISPDIIMVQPDTLMYVPASVAELAWALVFANLVMGIFNLVPVFPMDGGRMLRAALAYRLSYVRATFWAATVGKILAAAAIFYALVQGFEDPQSAGPWLLAVLFAFIFGVGELEYRAVKTRERQEEQLRAWAARVAALREAQWVPENPTEPPLLGPN